jgi:hypothetical protein
MKVIFDVEVVVVEEESGKIEQETSILLLTSSAPRKVDSIARMSLTVCTSFYLDVVYRCLMCCRYEDLGALQSSRRLYPPFNGRLQLETPLSSAITILTRYGDVLQRLYKLSAKNMGRLLLAAIGPSSCQTKTTISRRRDADKGWPTTHRMLGCRALNSA